MLHQDPPQSIRKLLLGIWGHLSRRRRTQFGLLFLVMHVAVGRACSWVGRAIFGVLSDPEKLLQHSLIHPVADRFGWTNQASC